MWKSLISKYIWNSNISYSIFNIFFRSLQEIRRVFSNFHQQTRIPIQIQPTQKLEREVIHQLCLSAMAHSDLVKNIYPDKVDYLRHLRR